MKYTAALLFAFTLFFSGRSQTTEGSEVGADLIFSASNFGGTAGLGLKYGVKFGEYFIAGPSFRYQRTWNKNVTTGTAGGFNVYGGGAFLHARFFNALFLGAEYEILRSPYSGSSYWTPSTPTWANTFFLGGGFSMEFNEKIRLNAGIMYDVVNAANSPFRPGYFVQKKTSTGANAGYLPIIYRIAFFFPIS